MITFIVCDDNKKYLINNVQIINEVMMKNDYSYKTKKFDEVNEELFRAINGEGPKIFIIDLELGEKSGLDLISKIRKKDYHSPIIVSSVHDEMILRVFKSKNMILDFISKYDDHNNNLTKKLENALEVIERSQIIKHKKNGEILFLHPKDIIYIMKKNNSNGLFIKTIKEDIEINTSLVKFSSKLDKNFLKVHRSCFVNRRKIKKINLKEGSIQFKENIILKNIISRNYKKNIEAKKNDI